MSSTTGVIFSKQGGPPLGFFQHNTTSGSCAVSHIYSSAEALWGSFVDGKGFVHEWINCVCGIPGEEVWFYEDWSWKDHTNGVHWNGKWCPVCKAITDGFNKYHEQEDCPEMWCEDGHHPPHNGLPPKAEYIG